MKKRTLRLTLKASLLANVVLLIAIFVDATRYQSRWMVPLLVLYGAFFLALLLLFLARPQHPAHLPESAETDSPDDTRLAIVHRP